MLAFVTSIRHPRNANDFSRVERFFEMSLRSVCAQLDDRFRVVVVTNVRPDIRFDHPSVAYHLVDYPPPTTVAAASTGMDAVMRDKGTKLLSGALYARQFDPNYIAFWDADDLVSRRLTGFVNASTGPGWFVDSGYCLNWQTGRVQRRSGLVRFCGTTLVARAADLYRFIGPDLTERDAQDRMRAVLPRDFLHFAMGDPCPHMVRYFAARGLKMRSFPFRAAVWVQGTGENHTAVISTAPAGVAPSAGFCAEFGFESPACGQPATLRQRVLESRDAVVSRIGAVLARTRGYPPAAQ